jgi:hypothetical protein
MALAVLSCRKDVTMDQSNNERTQSGAGLAAKRTGLGLGYFSLALGALEVAAPGRLARWLGLEGSKTARNTLIAFGIREIAAGGMLLRGPAVSTNVWNRVIGDAIDAGALGLAMRSSTRKGAVAGAMAFVGGAMLADVLTARALDRDTGRTFPVSARGAA